MDPNIKRIGKYKSAGDQLLRRDMSEPQREQLTAILDDLYEGFTQQTAASRGKTAQEVCPHAQEHTRGLLAVHAQAGHVGVSMATEKSVAFATRPRAQAAAREPLISLTGPEAPSCMGMMAQRLQCFPTTTKGGHGCRWRPCSTGASTGTRTLWTAAG